MSDAIIEQLLERVQSGELAAGDRVPSELELSEQLGVGRSSVREALKALEVLGVIERRHDGTVIRMDTTDGLLDRVVRAGFFGGLLEVAHLFQARRPLEAEICAVAAANLDEESLVALEGMCAEMEAVGTLDFERFFDLDMRFHERVCQVAGNPVLTRLWRVIHELLDAQRSGLAASPAIIAQSNRNHRELIAALASQDERRVRDTVARTLMATEAVFKRTVRKEPEHA